MADKKLLLLRHAQARAGHPLSDDFARPLSAEGHVGAERQGQYLLRQNLVPQMVFCSSAKRARETWTDLSDALAEPPPVEFIDRLYGASPHGLLKTIQAAPEDAACLLLIAHNPGIAALALSLADPASNPMELAKMQFGYGAGDLAVFTLSDRPWREITDRQARLIQYQPAALLPA